jgi:ADP-ribose pyrophosphatase YjhB (NUDIX family)
MPKASIMAIFYRGNGKDKEILIAERLKSPFLNSHGVVTGKIKMGEEIETSMIRECIEETGLKPIKYKLTAVERWIDYDSITKELMNDAVFFVFEVTKWKGDLIEKTNESFNKWCKISDLKDVPKKLPTIDLISKSLYKNDLGQNVKFKERVVEIENF